MKRLDRQWLADLGIRGLSPELADDLFRRVIDELEKRVGAKIATRLSQAEISEFDAMMEDPDERATSEWLSQHVPDREQIVLATFDEVEQELRDRRDEINALGEASAVGTPNEIAPQEARERC